MDSFVWSCSDTLLPGSKAIGEMISWAPSIPTVYENGSGHAATHAGDLAKATSRLSPCLMPRIWEEVLCKMSSWRVAWLNTEHGPVKVMGTLSRALQAFLGYISNIRNHEVLFI